MECLKTLVEAAGDDNDDISLWRIVQSERGQPEIKQFSGKDLTAGIEYGQEVR
jgi:hypothetical protein